MGQLRTRNVVNIPGTVRSPVTLANHRAQTTVPRKHFVYTRLPQLPIDGDAYPSEDLYPSDNLYPE